MSKISKFLLGKRYILRSGHAPGADKAFEEPVEMTMYKEIYIPWPGFEGSQSKYNFVTEDALKIAEKYHEYWNNVSLSSRNLLGRNAYIILGWRLNKPSDFVICYTIDGKFSGGTGHALRIAEGYQIPIYNLFYDDIRENIFKILERSL